MAKVQKTVHLLITTDQVPIYTPGWRERGTIYVITLPQGANLYRVWHQTHDHYVMTCTPSQLGHEFVQFSRLICLVNGSPLAHFRANQASLWSMSPNSIGSQT